MHCLTQIAGVFVLVLLATNAVLGAAGIEQKRFAYVEELSPGTAQGLVLAEINSRFRPGLTTPVARRILDLDQVIGHLPGPAGETPETYVQLLPSPSNRYLAALSVQIGGFIDANVLIYDMRTGTRVGRFNEHSFETRTDRTTCVSPLFEQFLADEAALGVPPAVLAGYNYSVDADSGLRGGRGVDLNWNVLGSEETLLIRYHFDVLLNIGANLGEDAFEYQIQPSAPAGSQIVSCNPGLSYAAQPPAKLSIGSSASAFPGIIHFNAQPLLFFNATSRTFFFEDALKAAGNVVN